MSEKPLLCIVAPALNEEAGIGEFCKRTLAAADACTEWRWEIIIVDDGSTDATAAVVREWRSKDSRVCLLSLTRNFGQEAAVAAGLAHARGDAIAVMDADLQDPPEILPQMLQKLGEGAEIVRGKYRREREGWFKTATAAMFYKMMRTMAGEKVQMTNANNFCVMSARCLRAFRAMPERGRYARGMLSWLGMPSAEVEFPRPPRERGDTKYTPAKMFALALAGVTSFSTTPLRWATYLGFGTFLFALMCGAYIVVALISGNAVPGWASILGFIAIFSAAQFAILGIIGEYLSAVLREVKRRPLYVRREFLGNHAADDSPHSV